MVVGVGKRRRGGRVQRDVKMDPPLWQLRNAECGVRIFGGERVGQIAVTGAIAGVVASDDLVEINGIGKFSQCLTRLGGWPDF